MSGWHRENIMQLENSARTYGMPEGMEARVGRWDAVRIAPRTARAIEAGRDGIAVLAFGARGMGIKDVESLQGWWG